MNRFALSLKTIGQRFMILMAGVVVLFATACSNEKLQASRRDLPNDVPVQAGANNNPYTMGADSHGEFVPPSNYGNRAFAK